MATAQVITAAPVVAPAPVQAPAGGSDLFAEAFGGFRDVGTARRHPAWITAVVLLAAVVLVGYGFVWARTPQGPTAAERVDAESLLAVFAHPQARDDVVAPGDLQGLGLVGSTTRFLVETPTGRHYAAVDTAGDLCALTVLDGDLPVLGCTAPVRGATVTGEDVMLVTDGAAAPAADKGWHGATAQVFVKD